MGEASNNPHGIGASANELVPGQEAPEQYHMGKEMTIQPSTSFPSLLPSLPALPPLTSSIPVGMNVGNDLGIQYYSVLVVFLELFCFVRFVIFLFFFRPLEVYGSHYYGSHSC